jgi:hypothetical protein
MSEWDRDPAKRPEFDPYQRASRRRFTIWIVLAIGLGLLPACLHLLT